MADGRSTSPAAMVPGVDAGDGGRSSALLREVLLRLEPHLPRIVDDFYGRLALNPAVAVVVARLTPAQFDHLRRRQVDHVRFLLRPDLDARILQEQSREVGRIHAMVGVEIDLFVDAVADHRRGLLSALAGSGPGLDLGLAQAIITERLMSDLHGALLGYRDLDAAESKVLLRVLEVVSDAGTVPDLVQGVVDALGSLDGMAVCLFARQADDDAKMQYEIGGGAGFPRFLAEGLAGGFAPVTTGSRALTGRGPIGRAWRTGVVHRCDSLQLDPTVAPWRAMADLLGWASSAAVPLVDRSGHRLGLFSLQAYWPGYFSGAGRIAMLEQVKRVTERALADLENRPTLSSGVSGYRDRAAHLDLLRRGEVEMLFQPVIGLADGRVHRFEALARLRDGDRLVSPAEFLPAFGDDELFALFDHGLRQSLTALADWEQQGLTTGVSLNLPAVAADDGRFVREVARMVARSGIRPDRLTLELLETGAVERETARHRRSIDDFKDLGIRLAQDDLGSGYSSLLRLRHFPFDEVKIDQSLVKGAEGASGSGLHFIEPINDIAHSLGLNVVIEGLEDDSLIEVGVALGVDEGQGYGIARPMPAGEVVEWARAYRFEHDASEPQTSLGALAAHVAWEHRVAAPHERLRRTLTLAVGPCGLATFLRRTTSPDDEVHGLHDAVHTAALAGRGSPQHRAAWARLVERVNRP